MTPAGGAPPPSASARPVALLGAAFASNAALVVLQTVTFHLLAWDSPAIPRAGLAFRVAFVLSDALACGALLLLLRSAPQLRGFTASAALVAGGGAFAGLAGLASRLASAEARALHSVARALNGAEPITALAVALLVTLTLATLAPRRSTLFTALVALTIALTLGFKVAAFVEREPRSIPVSWLVWSIDVVRPFLVAAFALLVARALRITTAVTAGAPAGPYREPSAGAPSPPRIPPPDSAGAAKLRSAASGLAIYRVGFLLRIAGTVGTSLLVVLAMTVRARDFEIVTIILLEATSFVTAAIVATGLVKMLALPRSNQTRSLVILALVVIAVSALADGATIAFGVTASFGSMSYQARRELGELLVLTWPLSAICAGTSLLLVASAIRRIGEALIRDDLVTRTRWIQGLAILAGALQLATVFAGFGMQSVSRYARYGETSTAGLLVVGLLAITAFGSAVAITILHVLGVGSAKKALSAHADKAG